MKKAVQIVLILILFTGCGTPIKQTWYDFTAYYNTFYNAKQYYSQGLESNKRQVPEINPEQPIRVHISPTNAGLDDFERAIERGASILINHENSRYVNRAILLIGQSYFYRSEFFSAMEKFRELQTVGNSTEQQKAILWQGRTYLEMLSYSEGVRFLTTESELIEEWDRGLLAETELVIAQLYASQQNWESSKEFLQAALPGIEDGNLKGRGMFLYGQLLERVGEDREALFAYSRAGSVSSDYDLEFNALRKEAEVSRRIGNYAQAASIYRNMERDDKFIEYRDELQFEFARTRQEQGSYEEALRLYNNILRHRFQTPSALTRAKIFFGIGEIYRDYHENFALAAAYFDSSASERVDFSRLPEKFDARELSVSFGEYTSISAEITRLDSLLKLGEMDPAELDSVIAEIQRIRMDEMMEERSRMRSEQDRMVVLEQQHSDSVIEAGQADEFGFLNVRSEVMVNDASLQFQAIWGDRPVADNWRRRADISGSRFDQQMVSRGGAGPGEDQAEQALLAQQTGIDLTEIPVTDDEQAQVRTQIEDLNYRLANVYFLSLNIPDSASVFYQKVVESSLNPALKPRAYYTLAEIELLAENRDRAMDWADLLFDEFPNSIFSQRISERLDLTINLTLPEEEFSVESNYYSLDRSSGLDAGPAERAKELQKLAFNGAGDSHRPLLLFEAAGEYIRAARLESENDPALSEWFEFNSEWDRKRAGLEQIQDSARVVLADTSLTESERSHWEAIVDSTLTKSDVMPAFPFEGTYWDSTRSVLNHIETYYASSSIMPRVRTLKQTLEFSAPEPKEEEFPEGIEELMQEQTETEISLCSERGVEISGGEEAFLRTILFPDWTENMSMRGEISYRFSISEEGDFTEYEQISRIDRTGIPEAFEAAFDQYLNLDIDGQENLPLECLLTFPIDL